MSEVWRSRFKGWRTMLLLCFPLYISGLLDILNQVDLRSVLPDNLGWVCVGIAIAAGVLRLITTGPVGCGGYPGGRYREREPYFRNTDGESQ